MEHALVSDYQLRVLSSALSTLKLYSQKLNNKSQAMTSSHL